MILLKNIKVMELKFSAIKVNIFHSKCAKNQTNFFFGSLVRDHRIRMLFSEVKHNAKTQCSQLFQECARFDHNRWKLLHLGRLEPHPSEERNDF